MKSPLAQARNQADVTKNAFNGRRRAAQHRRSFRCRVIKSQSLVELLLIMRHRNASSFYDRFRKRILRRGLMIGYVGTLLRYISQSTDA